MPSINTPVLLFDLDGTISDPLEGIWRSLNYALEHYGYQPLGKKAAANFIGPPLDEIFISMVSSKDQTHIKALVDKYRERFSQIGYTENRLYPGMTEAIAALYDRRVTLGVCTSKRKDFAEKILQMFGLREYFAFVSGGDVGIKKAGQIKQLLTAELIDKNAVMIGDRAVDMQSARQNGIDSAAVLWGYGSMTELQEQKPTYLLSEPHELTQLAR